MFYYCWQFLVQWSQIEDFVSFHGCFDLHSRIFVASLLTLGTVRESLFLLSCLKAELATLVVYS